MFRSTIPLCKMAGRPFYYNSGKELAIYFEYACIPFHLYLIVFIYQELYCANIDLGMMNDSFYYKL